jgi:tetratricopeptide (TPR) repeat protein
MTVRVTGFQRLSDDLPATMPDAVRDEITAAFGDQGVVGVSTAAAPAAGDAPAYALGGTIRRDGGEIRVITRLTNERSGATLWSFSTDYDAAQLARVPRRIAVDAARMARCGLFAASTYRKPLPDSVLSDYMQFCQTAAVFQSAPTKGLDSARKVTAAAPDFSWGWSAVATGASLSRFATPMGAAREEVRQTGLQASDKALSLDRRNSEALSMKAMLIDTNQRIEQEELLKRAIAARPLDCGCEHLLYGLVLENAGRYSEASQQFRRAVDMLALDENSQFALADSLSVAGRPDEAKAHFNAMIDLSRDPQTANFIAVVEAPENGNYEAAIKALQDPKFELPEQQRAAFIQAFRALESPKGDARSRAAQMLLALQPDQQDVWTVKLLAALGANREAFQLFVRGLDSRFDWPSVLWYRSMRGVLDQPAIPAILQRLGLMKYWRATRTRPDVCSARVAPSFCRMIK